MIDDARPLDYAIEPTRPARAYRAFNRLFSTPEADALLPWAMRIAMVCVGAAVVAWAI